MKRRRPRHPLYPEKGVSRNSDLPIRDPEEDLSTQFYVSKTLEPGKVFELDSHVKVLKRPEAKPEAKPESRVERAKRKVRDRDADILSEIFGREGKR